MYYLIAFCIGIASSMQAPINALLAKNIQSSVLFSATLAFGIGFICLLLVSWYNHALSLESFKALANQSLWKFSGGILGAFVVFAMAFLTPKIGVANMVLFVILGQISSGLVMDNYGLFELAKKPFSLERIGGIVIIGIGLVVFFIKELRG